MYTLIESTWPELYQSAVDAFPGTTCRQYAVDPIAISEIMIVPFVGFRTLFIRGTATNEEREYRPMVLVKGIGYHDDRQSGDIQIRASDGQDYWLEQPTMDDSEILLRCNCNDFNFRFTHYNFLDKSLYGRNRKKYYGHLWEANPRHLPGLCKHLIKFGIILKNSGLIV